MIMMKTKTICWHLVLSLALVLGASGCWWDDNSGYYYYDDAYATYESAYWMDYEDAYYYYGYDPLYGYYWLTGSNSVPEDAAAMIASLADQYFTPAGCAKATSDGPTATFVLDDCQGPISLRNVSGEVRYTYSQIGDALGLDIETTNLTVGATELTLDSSSVAFADPEQQGLLHIETMSTITGTSLVFGTIERTSERTTSWRQGEDCLDIEGSVVDRGDREATTSIENYRRCDSLCPERGTLTREFDDRSVEVTFDGSMQATWTADNDETGTIDLDCEVD